MDFSPFTPNAHNHRSNSNASSNIAKEEEYELKSNIFKFAYIILTIIKSCLGLYILFKHRHLISSNTRNHLIFYISYYTILWPIAFIGSFFFFLCIFSIDCLLKLIKLRANNNQNQNQKHKKLEEEIKEIPESISSYGFIYTTFIIFIVISYIISIPASIYFLNKIMINEIKTNDMTTNWIYAFFFFNFIVSILVFIMFIFYTFVIRELNKHKIDIEDEFLEKITKEVELSRRL